MSMMRSRAEVSVVRTKRGRTHLRYRNARSQSGGRAVQYAQIGSCSFERMDEPHSRQLVR